MTTKTKVKKAELKKVKSVKAEVKKEVSVNNKIGNYVIKETTNEFSLSRLVSKSGKRHFILASILELGKENLKGELVLNIKNELAKKESLKGKTEIAYSLIGKYNRFLIANDFKLRIKSKGVAVEGKKVLMSKNITLYIPKVS